MVKTFPTLYGRDSKGRTKVWHIEVVGGFHEAEIATQYGLTGGKQQRATDSVTEGKNIGRSNETSPYDQAVSEACSKWKKQLDKGYVESPVLLDAVSEMASPMLAHAYKKRSHNIVWPAAVQPKLDGIRMLAHVGAFSVDFRTRRGKPITTVGHLAGPLLDAFPEGTVVDGELFNPDMTLQDIGSGSKKLSEKSARLQYWIYDLVEDHPFSRRHRCLRVYLEGRDDLVLVPTISAPNETAMLEMHACHLAAGFEGSIVRNLAGLYKRGKRSADLQKVKQFSDCEFVISDYRDGRGKFKGLVIFECETPEGKPFDVVPIGDEATRREYFENGASYVGKQLTVRYANLTPDGIPFNAVGLAVRDYE